MPAEQKFIYLPPVIPPTVWPQAARCRRAGSGQGLAEVLLLTEDVG